MKNKYEGCDLYKDGCCIKFGEKRKHQCEPSTRDWLVRDKFDEPLQFISEEKMCRKGSIFGNEYIGLTQNDLDRIKNGEIVYIPGEYGTFIGFVSNELVKQQEEKEEHRVTPIKLSESITNINAVVNNVNAVVNNVKLIGVDDIDISKEMEMLNETHMTNASKELNKALIDIFKRRED